MIKIYLMNMVIIFEFNKWYYKVNNYKNGGKYEKKEE